MVRLIGACACGLAAVLAGCATPPAGSDAAQLAAAKPTADPGCVSSTHNGMLRPGDNIPVHMTVAENHGWCFYGVGISGVSTQGSRVVDQPGHGQLRLLVRPNGTFFGYRPAAGYAGGDSFLISVPGGFGYENNIAVTVAVQPAPAP